MEARGVARVLVADDLTAIREIVRITLSGQGWEILEAATPDDVLRVAREDRPDVILLDVDLRAARTGFDVCRELKRDAATRGIPVVMLTVHGGPAQRAEGVAAGAARYLEKPFSPLALLATLAEFAGPPAA